MCLAPTQLKCSGSSIASLDKPTVLTKYKNSVYEMIESMRVSLQFTSHIRLISSKISRNEQSTVLVTS